MEQTAPKQVSFEGRSKYMVFNTFLSFFLSEIFHNNV